ncbi:MAG: tRNA pseudouridine(38-40) synthase TruA, partial [Acidobacteriaceae bacterium]|nr:tRNA pseudouridine(38-40) synthase TruA [Acidobacteriaceae bacterium]
FTAFAASDEKDLLGASKVRWIFYSGFIRKDETMIYQVTGSGFLKHMVRNIVGVLLEVGKRNLHADDVLARLRPGCKIAPGPAAPARGLFLLSVDYE